MIKRKVYVALLSTIIFSIMLAYIMYTPISDRHPDTWYDSFGAPIPFLLCITGVAYLLGGIPVSLFIDKYIDKEILKLPLYLIAGFIVGVLTMMISFGTFSLQMFGFGIFGATGSLIFFIVMSCSKYLQRSR